MMDPATVIIKFIPIIAKACLAFHKALKQVKANRTQSMRLSERIESIRNCVDQLKERKLDKENMERMLKSYCECVHRCTTFISKFAGNSWFKHVFSHKEHKEEFAKLNLELSGHAMDFQLNLNIEQLFDHRKDEADRLQDLTDIESQLGEISTMMAKNQAELIGQVVDLKKLIDSYRLELIQALGERRSIDARNVEERSQFRHIPLYDLISEECVGEGSFADVYRGKWLSQHHQIAIKVIRVGHLSKNVKKNFISEISMMYQMRFDNILTIFGACMETNYHAIIVEYMALGSLADVLKKMANSPLPWLERWLIALQMVKGINYLHQWTPRPIVHCDIKSSNFLVDHNGNGFIVKIGDFGLTHIRQETAGQTRPTGDARWWIGGTLQWKAPELFKFKEKHTTASDIYALGIVFWELATHCIPYEDKDEAIIRIQVMAKERLDIPRDVPPVFASLITKSWTHEPTQRPSSAELLVQILEHVSPSSTPVELAPKHDVKETR